MPLTKSARTTKLLNFAHNVVTNAIEHEEILSLLSVRGFPRTSFNQGKALYEAATVAVGVGYVLEDDLHALEDRVQKGHTIIAERYLAFINTAKASLGKNAMTMIGIPHRLPRAGSVSCESAQSTFKKVLEHPNLAEHLAKTGWDEQQIRSVSGLIELCESDVKAQVQFKISLAHAADDRDRALTELREWLSAFSTAAASALDSDPHLPATLQIEVQDLYLYASIRKAGALKARPSRLVRLAAA